MIRRIAMTTAGVSAPSARRRVAAGMIAGTALLLGLLLKIARDRGILPFLLPLDAAGTSPSFILPFALPFLFLARDREVRWRDTLKTAAGAGLGMVGYEVLQLWLPGRTFDPNDVVAGVLGTGLGVVVAWALFHRRRPGDRP